MPRQLDTIEKVQRAADDLLASGQRPTQQAIRDVLGTGSITTINKALNIWWANLSKRINRQEEYPTLPEPVLSAATKLWDQALVYSHSLLEKQTLEHAAQLAKKKASNDQKFIEAQDKLLSAQQLNSRMLTNNEALIMSKQVQSEKIHELESFLIQKNADNDALIRLNKQHEILLAKQSEPNADAAQLFQAKIDLKVCDSLNRDLRDALQKSEELQRKASLALIELEKSSMKQIHRLELVIAQRDTKYNNIREQLASFEINGR